MDGTNSEIVVLNTNGEFVEDFGQVGHDDGYFYYPDGIDYYDGKLVIADKFNDRVEVFAAPGAAPPWTTYVPYVLLLLLLPLLLIPFLLRRRRYIASPEFITVLGGAPDGPEVASRLKRLYGTAALGAVVANDDIDVDWKDKDLDEEKVAALAGQYSLDDETAAALYVASSLRGKRVLLAETDQLRGAAVDLGVPTATYDEIKGALGGDSDSGGDAASLPEDGSPADSRRPCPDRGRQRMSRATLGLTLLLLMAAVAISGCSSPGADLPEPELVAQETTITGVFFSSGRSLVEERRIVDADDVYMATMSEWLAAAPEDNPDMAIVQPEAEVIGVTLSDGVLTIDWSAEVLDFEATESEQLVALAGILRTFGQFPEVDQVRFTVEGVEEGEVNGKDVQAFWGSATLIEQPWDVFRPQPPPESEESSAATS